MKTIRECELSLNYDGEFVAQFWLDDKLVSVEMGDLVTFDGDTEFGMAKAILRISESEADDEQLRADFRDVQQRLCDLIGDDFNAADDFDADAEVSDA